MSPAEELQRTLAERPGSVVFVVGSGVASTGLPTWSDLLRSGLRRAHALGRLDAEELALFERQLTFTSPTARAAVADVVARGLPNGEFPRWLQEQFGHVLPTSNSGVLAALAEYERRGALLATTNFDTRLENATGLASATWHEPAVEHVLRGDERRILHLHGVWNQPETVVLAAPDYADVLLDPATRTLFSAILATRTLVFVGYRASREEPNAESFLHWIAEAPAPAHHYRLVPQSNQAAPPDPIATSIVPLIYGDSDEALAAFLQYPLSLGPSTPREVPTVDATAITAYRLRLLQRVAPMRALWPGSRAAPETLESLFVEPRLTRPQRLFATRRQEPAGAHSDESAPELAAADEVPLDLSPTAWQERLPGPERPGVLILGDLGAGKSTALRVVLRRLCRGGEGLPDHLHDKIPVWVELHEFARQLPGGPAKSALLRHVTRAESDLPNGLLHTLDAAGRLVWLLDGLDEVVGESRNDVIAAIEALLADDTPRLVLVASRPHPAPLLSSRFERHELAPWNDESILNLARGYYRVIQPAPDVDARAARILAALQANVALYELCQWPLFLGLVLSLGHAGDIPWPRHRLYRRALELILDEWDSVSQVGPVKLASDDKLAFLRKVAWTMLQRGQLALPRTEVTRLASEFFATFDEPPASAAALATTLVDDLCLRGSLLVPTPDGALGFSHRAWHDYTAARELHSRRETERELFATRWNDPIWSGALLVAVGLLAEDSLAEVPPLLHAVLRSHLSLAPRVLAKPLAFVVQALGYCVHLRREPVMAFGRALTTCMLELDVVSMPGIESALYSSGPSWPGAEQIRDAAEDEWSGASALSVCGIEDRADLLVRCLKNPLYAGMLVSMGRHLGAWRISEVRRLLSVPGGDPDAPSPLSQSAGWSLHIADGLLVRESIPEVLAHVRTRLRTDIPEVQAYAATLLLRAGLMDSEVLDTLASAIPGGSWKTTTSHRVSILLGDFLDAAPEPIASKFRQIMQASPLHSWRLVKGVWPANRAPDFDVRSDLDLPEDVPLTEAVIASRLTELDIDRASIALQTIAELDFLPPSMWQPMARALLERCEDPAEQFMLAILLGDRALLTQLTKHGRAKRLNQVLRQAEALDAVLRVGRLRRGRVMLAGHHAGTLEELPGARTRFTYMQTYLATPRARPLAPTMPLRGEPYERDGLHAYFANLLPQGAVLELKARTHSLSASDSFGLLLALGADLPGAVEIFEDEG